MCSRNSLESAHCLVACGNTEEERKTWRRKSKDSNRRTKEGGKWRQCRSQKSHPPLHLFTFHSFLMFLINPIFNSMFSVCFPFVSFPNSTCDYKVSIFDFLLFLSFPSVLVFLDYFFPVFNFFPFTHYLFSFLLHNSSPPTCYLYNSRWPISH